MAHDDAKSARRDSHGVNTHPNPTSTNDGGSMATPQAGETRSQGTVEPQGYAAQGSDGQPQVGDPSLMCFIRDTRSSTPVVENPPKRWQKEQNSALEPPVTKATLSELDVNKIVQNPKLRHDINFDPDLHFRPNLDGEKGRRKAQKASDFWETMRRQLQDFLMNKDQFEVQLRGAEWSLPACLKAIRGILETLVPQRDRSSVEETFNVDLLMQQFRKGVADLEKLALWLSQLLKCHCAPMRDDWVDEMVNQLSNGNRTGDVALLVSGMRDLLGVLEAMKLDVANHQIRCLRPLLIEDTVHFEQKFFMKKIAVGRVDVAGAHTWFKRASNLSSTATPHTSVHSQGNTWDFMKALVNLTLPSKSSEMVPHTFLFDEERLIKLRSDMQDLINLEVCLDLYRGLEAQSKIQEPRYLSLDDMPTTSFTSSPYDRPTSPMNDDGLSSPTLPSEHHFMPKFRQDIFTKEHGPLARVLPSHRVLIDDEIITSSSSSSPLSSSPSTISTSGTYTRTPLYISFPQSNTASQVRNSLVAILNSSPAPNKWNSLSASLALQILRSTPTPLTRLPQFETHLAFHLSNPRSRMYQEAESRILSRLFPALQKLVESYTPLTSLQVFEAATSPRMLPTIGHGSGATTGSKEEINEVATRIAHIGILHWRVWAPLAYLVDPDAEEEVELDMRQDLDSSDDETKDPP